MHPHHVGQWIRRYAAPPAGLGVVGLNQIERGLPRHNNLNLREEILLFGPLLCGNDFAIRVAELLVTHQLRPDLRLQVHCTTKGDGFPETP
jgi:hypothetical protein